MKKLFFIIFLAAGINLILAQDGQLLRFPALNYDATQIAFSFQGDIWTVSSSGGKALRLTVHSGYESNPVFSPDGKQIAFSAARFGNNDIFTIPSEGGTPKRLTFHSSPDNISNWASSGKILFTTNREFNKIERPQEIFEINSSGGTEYRIMDAMGFEPALSPNGRFIAFVRGDINPVFREDYRGPSNRDIWLFDTKTKKYSRLTEFETNDISPRWANDNTIYFLSSNDGQYNIYKLTMDENGNPFGKPVQFTKYTDHSIRHFSISGDGTSIVFEKDKNIYFTKIATANTQRVTINIAADDRLDAFENKTFNKDASEYAISPNGKLIAYVVRGEIFVKEADKDKSRSINLSESPYRDRDVAWLNDTTIIFSSDRSDNNFDFYLVKSADKTQPDLFKSLKHNIIRLTETDEDEYNPVISNDGKKIAYIRGLDTKQFLVADISADGKLSSEKILYDGWAVPSGVVWSPDDKWLAYSQEDLYFNEDIFIRAADNSKAPVNISMHPREDSQPFWSADGSKLGFLSGRSTQNGLTGGLSRTRDVWFVWLKKSDWEKTNQDWEDKDTPAEKKDDKSKDKSVKKDSLKTKLIQIDFDDIYKRAVQVTSFNGDETNVVISKDGETFYYVGSSSSAKGHDLFSIKWDGKDLKELTKGGSNPGNLLPDKEYKYIYYAKQGGSLNRIDLKSEKAEALPYSAKMTINFAAERNQIFEEGWRAIRDGFYDPQFHGYNWNALRDKYKELCLIASTSNDFRDMFNNMLGELNASHMGMFTQEREETQQEATGLLGVELTPVDNGMKIIRVIPNSPADKSSSKLFAGEVITAVDNVDIKEANNFYQLLNSRVNEMILVTVLGTDKKEREVKIRPVNNLRQLLYEEWVAERKGLVEKYSGGKLGYIHIQGMNMASFEDFERELTAAGYNKEGLVVDVRYNGGGSTTDYLMTVLNYKQHAYTIPRGASDNPEKDKLKFRDYYPTGERLVFAAWLKSSIALCNEGSYSNAEIFSHAYKTLGIGTLVGVPTNGSVISTGARMLIDGSAVRLPGRGWYVKATDKNEELGPAVPDIIIYNQPDWLATGIDTQLKTACEVLLKQIDSQK